MRVRVRVRVRVRAATRHWRAARAGRNPPPVTSTCEPPCTLACGGVAAAVYLVRVRVRVRVRAVRARVRAMAAAVYGVARGGIWEIQGDTGR